MNRSNIRSITHQVAPLLRRVGGSVRDHETRKSLLDSIEKLIKSFTTEIESIEGEYLGLMHSLSPLRDTDDNGNTILLLHDTVESEELLKTAKRLKGHVARLQSARYRHLARR